MDHPQSYPQPAGRLWQVPVALPVPLRRCFDYHWSGPEPPPVGARVAVPFGRQRRIGVVWEGSQPITPAAAADLKAIEQVLDDPPLLEAPLRALAAFAADYYQHPLGEVLESFLPPALHAPPPARARSAAGAAGQWLGLSAAGRSAVWPARAPRLLALRAALEAGPQPRTALTVGSAVLARARAAGWIEAVAPEAPAAVLETPPALRAEQAAAVAALSAASGFAVFLLEGVTGSGKTEVYLRRIAQALDQGQQVLVLVPEIGLTPQLAGRLRARFGAERVGAYHSGLSAGARSAVWQAAREGRLALVVGTRSAVFLPLPRLGLVVIDEEHDASFKQQEGLRYSARDLAIVRARAAGVPVLLGSATPSLESLWNASQGRYRHLLLRERANRRPAPRIGLIDLRGQPLDAGLSPPLLAAVDRHLGEGGQVLLFLNRRGYAPALLCHDCGWTPDCRHCDARLTLHRARGRLICHHCGASSRVPSRCGGCGGPALQPAGQGTERLEAALAHRYPTLPLARLDTDRTRRAGVLETLLEGLRDGRLRLAVGTQMLAKGHDFAGLSLVGIVDVDQALHSADFRALERMGQLVSQVAGRAGRAERPGEVWLQTHHPDHPQLRRLVREGYAALAAEETALRQRTGLPPHAHLALLRAESPAEGAALQFLEDAAGLFEAAGVDRLGPIPAPMERRAGRWRAQLLLRAAQRPPLQALLRQALPRLEALKTPARLRWSLDVDPVDLF
ncbi:MAG TPA: primosomal protein N' [Nevskiaceae bacterium]|nr:primosomal protein N' [Nevskiaceae bacterium]